MLCKFALLTLLVCCYATPPPGYVKPPEFDQYPPKYEYGYTIQDNQGSGQGKLESREGIFSLGRYFVQLGGPKGASQNVEYTTDEWGYHPLVEYSSVGDHSSTSTQFALGEKAVEALRKNNKNQLQGNNHLNHTPQPQSAPSPTQSTNIPVSVKPPSSSPTTITILQNSPQQPKPKLHHPTQGNLPLLQNTIPLQYVLQPYNLPQAQYLIQPQVESQNQYLIQEQHIPQTQFLIPLYDTGLDNGPQIHQVNFNLPQQNFVNHAQIQAERNNNVKLLAQNVFTQNKQTGENVRLQAQNSFNQNKQTQENANLELQKTIAATNQLQDKKVSFVSQNNQEHKQNIVANNFKLKIEANQNNNGIIQNNQEQNIVVNIPQQEFEANKLKHGISQEQNVQNNQEQKQNIVSNPQQEAIRFINGINQQSSNQNIQEQKQNIVFNIPQQEFETIRNNNGIQQQQINQNIQEQNNVPQQEFEAIQFNNGVNQQSSSQIIQEQKQNIVFNIPKQEFEEIRNNNAINQQQSFQNIEDQKQNILSNIQQELEKIQINQQANHQYYADNIQHNNGQYLVEVKEQPQQILQTQENKIAVQNSEHTESSTIKYSEKFKQDQQEIEYIAQAIQNDLNLQNTEPLFGNAASEVQYTSNRNTLKEQNNFDESILDLENPGGYGSRIKAKKPSINVNNNQDVSTRLLDRTRNLVTGVDVLNINDAITNYVATASAEYQNEQQNKNIINEYNSGQVQYGYNENVPNTILEAVSNLNNKNILNNIQEQKVVVTTADYNNQEVVQQSSIVEQTNQQNNLITSSSTYNSPENSIQNGRNKLLEILNSEKVQTESKAEQNKHISLSDQPIIVEDYESYQDNSVQSTTERYKEETIAETIYSTTQNTIETKITEDNIVSTESPILITPRPVSNSFLAPITAAVSLQNSATDIEDNYAPETSVEVQKSVPYYLGKIELVESQESYSSQQQSSEEESLSTKLVIQNNESGSNEEQFSQESSNKYPKAEALIQSKGQNKLNDEENASMELKQLLDFDAPTGEAEAQESKVVNKPAEINSKPYPIEIPYPDEKQISVEVEKIVEKPIHITKIVEKQIPIHIPQPYPVEVERIVEKQVRVPVEITKYINNPYPVHIPYPEPIAVPVEVERLVQTIVKEPYPVEVPVPYEVKIKVPVPHPVQVTKYVDKPYPVEKIVERPVTVEKIVEKSVTKYIDKPYPVHVHVPVPHPVAVPVEIKVPHPYPVEVTKYIEKPYGLAQAYSIPVPKTVVPPNNHQIQHQVKHPVTKLVQIPVELPKYFERQAPLYVNFHQQHKQNPYLYAPKYQIEWKNVANCELNHKHNQNQNPGQYRFAKIQDYIGLVPPVPQHNVDYGKVHSNYKRKARNSFEQNLRIEYGFKPPIIPSIQTDEFGMPLNEEE